MLLGYSLLSVLISIDFVIGIQAWHLAPVAANTCDFGRVAIQGECEAAVLAVASQSGTSPGRSLQVGNGGTCKDGGWGNVPIGCSAQTGGDWTAHYKSKGSNCNFGYQLVCSEDQSPEIVLTVLRKVTDKDHPSEIAESCAPATGIKRYIPSEFEMEWTTKKQTGQLCNTAWTQRQAAILWVNYSKSVWKPDGNSTSRPPNAAEEKVLSKFLRDDAEPSFIEPLSGMARHPLSFYGVHCKPTSDPSIDHMFNARIFDISYLIVPFKEAVSGGRYSKGGSFLNMLRTVKPEDFVVVKLDIDGGPEFEIAYAICEQPDLYMRVDEIFFEYHFNFDGLNFGWGRANPLHTVDHAIAVMRCLRERGVRSHFWI
eukprot:TRINITY_DN12510_c0_g1_i2.p1 TRINITY_DN12510_c0_g1~~TRINITY_DN12510_c0_g1_i2.p1  ORF type:complete len:369 (-),score=58.04 TRINITY_DN12510_c0_g1_i2:81-1187(-)